MKSNLLKTILKVAWRVPLAYIFWMKRYAVNQDKYSVELKYNKLRRLVTRINKNLEMEIHVSGLENVPKETCAFFSNHVAAVDPVPIITTLEKPMTFLAKQELESVPFLVTAIRSVEGLFIKRDDLKQSLRTMMKIEDDLRSHRKNWLIFPEGTRNKDSRALLLEFHHGTFRPAMKAGVPLVPVAIFGTQRVISSKSKLKKYPVQLIFGKPIMPNEYKDMKTEDVAKEVQSRVQYMLTYQARKDDRAILVKNLGDKFKENL